jgi:hypothetical protein
VRGNIESALDGQGKEFFVIKQLLLEMARHLGAGLEHGEYLNKAEHLDLERFMVHALVQNSLVPPREVRGRRGVCLEMAKKLAPDCLGLMFDFVGESHRRLPSLFFPV